MTSNHQAVSPEERFFSSDQPIAHRSDDRLGRRMFAEALARQIATAPVETGFVVGLTGAWGSGKTSILNMVDEVLAEDQRIVVLPFNPWLFSGTEQLVTAFFGELGAQLFKKQDERLRKIGELLETYGQAVSPLTFVPVVGAWAGRLGKVAAVGGRLLKGQQRPVSAQEQRDRIVAALKEIGGRFVIILDDIDRLRPDEILHVMKLVKLAADFPRVVYLLSFDRHRVEEALQESESGSDRGRNYLEKIVQVIHDVPIARKTDVFQLLVAELNDVIDVVPHSPFREEDWQNVSRFVMMPLFKSIRDVRRYMNGLPVALQSLGDEVSLVDVLALEAIRILVPDVFESLVASADILTDTSGAALQGALPDLAQETRSRLVALINQASDHKTLMEAVCRWLFPTTQRVLSNQGFNADMVRGWRRDRRVGHPAIFRFYLERSLPLSVLPVAKMQAIVDALSDEARLTELVSALSPPEVENAMERLGDFRDEFSPTAAEPATVVFMNQLPRLREGTRYPEDFGPVATLGMLVHFFLKTVDAQDERMRIAEGVIKRLTSLSARLVFLRWIGDDDDDVRLIAQEDQARLAESLRQQILDASDGTLADERNLGELLDWIVQTGGESVKAKALEVAENNEVMLRVLRSFLREVHGRFLGHAAFTTQFWLPWDEILVNIFGAQFLEARVARLAARVAPESLDERTRAALEVAVQYGTGWRPARRPRDRRRVREVREGTDQDGAGAPEPV